MQFPVPPNSQYRKMRTTMDLLGLLPLIIIMGAFMFFVSRRQRKAMQATIELHESLRVGDRVQTTSGLYGTITGLTDDAVDIEIAPGMVTKWTKLAIRDRVEPAVPADQLTDELADSDADRLPRD
jgi:preprotein translocase subunit YajC